MYVCNMMTQPGETDDYKVSDHIQTLNNYLGKRKIDAVIANKGKIPISILRKYETEEQKDQVKIDRENMENVHYELIEDDLLITSNGVIRHNSMKLSSIIFSYLMRGKQNGTD